MTDHEIERTLHRITVRQLRGIPEHRWPELDRRLARTPAQVTSDRRAWRRRYMRTRRAASTS